MRVTKISQGGQIQIPAEVRKRWGTRDVIVDDGGSYIRIRPVPDDPISAVAGIFAQPGGPTSEESVRRWREEDIAAEEAKWDRYHGRDRS
jgi:bifunctional DNA-binding transcriptional regulator/antitoxin component of YhaV-PrlF toxin-antitoxin module